MPQSPNRFIRSETTEEINHVTLLEGSFVSKVFRERLAVALTPKVLANMFIQYNDLSANLRKATMAENVERNRRGEQFMLLYAASYPNAPIRPVPLRVLLIAIAAGICVGAGLTLMREYFDRSVHDARDIKDEFDLPVLGEVGRIKAA